MHDDELLRRYCSNVPTSGKNAYEKNVASATDAVTASKLCCRHANFRDWDAESAEHGQVELLPEMANNLDYAPQCAKQLIPKQQNSKAKAAAAATTANRRTNVTQEFTNGNVTSILDQKYVSFKGHA